LERTLVLVKPDGVQRGLIGEIISRIERSGLRLVGLKLMQMDESLAREHYAEHVDKPFGPGLLTFITSGPVVAMVWEGPGAIEHVRRLMGKTKPAESMPGTIRGDFGLDVGHNLVHGSAGESDAAREIGIFFTAEELLNWPRDLDVWILDSK
jgi:nucleoside-diphosphate kinase